MMTRSIILKARPKIKSGVSCVAGGGCYCANELQKIQKSDSLLRYSYPYIEGEGVHATQAQRRTFENIKNI